MSKAKTEVARLIVSKVYYMKKLTVTSTNGLIPRFSFLRFCFLNLIDFTSYFCSSRNVSVLNSVRFSTVSNFDLPFSVFGSSINDQTGPLLKTSVFSFSLN